MTRTVDYIDKVIEIAESLEWNVTTNGNYINFQRYSSAGQDFNITINLTEDFENFCDELYEYYNSYDPSEEAYIWLDNSGHGVHGAPYEMIDVYNDMKECEGLILELWRTIISILKKYN